MSTIHRAIKAILYPNTMKNAKGSYLARTSKHTTYNIREICESAKEKTGIVTTDTLEYNVKLFFEEMLALLEDGNKINTGYFTAQANVKGAFNSKYDDFDAEKHSVDIVFSSAQLTRQKAKKLKAEILHIKPSNYGIRTVTDGQTKLDISKLVANRLLVISGNKVKIVGNEPSVGVYFVHTETGSETKVQPHEFYENSNAIVKILVPELASGTYQLKIITQYSGNAIPLLQTRSFCYFNMLHVD